MKKYKLLKNDTVKIKGKTLYRIQALRSFGNVNIGDLGGYIESEYNLSHEGICWVTGNAQVHGNARVCDNAKVYGNAQVYDNAKVYGNAQVYDNAKVYGHAWVCGNSKVSDEAHVYGIAEVYGEINIQRDARVNLTPILFYYKNIPCHFLKGDKIFLRAGCRNIYSWSGLRYSLNYQFRGVDPDALDLAYIQLKIFKKQIGHR